MSNDVNNLATSFVAMARAFEELPGVKAELAESNSRNAEFAETVQRLELRIIDLKGELDAAHAATRKAEVERDHAEEMFLSADDRLNAFTRLLASFQSDTAALVKAAEPAPETAPVSEPTVAEAVTVDPGPAIASHAPEWHGDPTNVDSVSSGPQGSREEDPTMTAAPVDTLSPSALHTEAGASTELTEGVSVPLDPTPVTETSSESVSLASTPEPATQAQEGNRVPDPTASSMAGDGPSPATAAATPSVDTSADASSTATLAEDDVGYHNEPKVENVGSADGWLAWDAWAARMNVRYGVNGWPSRDAQAAQ